MTKDERRELLNSLYALVFPLLNKYEDRYSNGHARTQILTEELAQKMDQWIASQTPAKHNPDECHTCGLKNKVLDERGRCDHCVFECR